MMVLIYSMRQNIRIFFFATKINQFSIISIKMDQFIFLELWILWMALGQDLLLTFLLPRSALSRGCCGFTLRKEIVDVVEIGLGLWVLYLLGVLSQYLLCLSSIIFIHEEFLEVVVVQLHTLFIQITQTLMILTLILNLALLLDLLQLFFAQLWKSTGDLSGRQLCAWLRLNLRI